MIELEAERLLQWQQGKKPGPLQVLIFPTFRCNLNCTVCSRHWTAEPRQFDEEMPTERLIELVDESAELGTKRWVIGGGGEPLLRPDAVMEMCRRIKGHGMAGMLQTNGTLLKPDQIDELVRLDLDAVNISIDGPTAEISDQLRFPGAYSKSTAAVRAFADAKKKYGRANPSVTVACVLSRFTSGRLVEMAERAREWGADNLLFIQMIIYHDAMKDLEMTPDQLARLREEYEQVRCRAEELGLRTTLSALPPGEQAPQLERKTSDNPFWGSLCVEPWLTLVVLTTGKCVPCCVYGYGLTDSVRETPLRQVWHGRELNTLRRLVLQGTVMPACEQCQAQYVNHRAAVLAEIDRRETYNPPFGQLVRKAWSSLGRHGLLTSLKRGREWILLHRKYGKRNSG